MSHSKLYPLTALVKWQVLDLVKSIAAETMGAEVAAEMPLMSAGLDSLGAVELRNGVSATFGIGSPGNLLL